MEQIKGYFMISKFKPYISLIPIILATQYVYDDTQPLTTLLIFISQN